MAARSIYLSPHLDDAALSCGGQIAQLTGNGQRVLVLTVCAGDAPVGCVRTEFVRELDARWKLSDPVAERRAEDLRALQTLRAEALHLNVPDCIYRAHPATGLPLYPDRQAIFGALSDQEERLVARVAQELRRLEPLRGATVYAPLGAGHHVDHQLVRAAAQQWGAPGGQLAYYEDYPYAEDAGALDAALEGKDLTPCAIRLEPSHLERKIAAVACYQSQLSTFFPDQAEMARRLWAFASLTGGTSLAERIWLPDSSFQAAVSGAS